MTDSSNNTLSFKKLSNPTAVSIYDVQSMRDNYGNVYTIRSGNFVAMKDVYGNAIELEGPAIADPVTDNTIKSVTDTSGNYYVVTSRVISSVQYGSVNYTVSGNEITDTSTGNKFTFNDSGLLSKAEDS